MSRLKILVIKIITKAFNYSGIDIRRIKTSDTDKYIRLYGMESVEKRMFYNISAGAFIDFGCGIHHPCWTNIDVDLPWKYNKYKPGYDIVHDLLSIKSIPVESSTAELVHSRFTIASITDEAAQFFFNEVFRILKKGGIFRIVTPDIDLDYRAYVNNDMHFFYWFKNNKSVTIEQAFLFHVASQASTIHPTSPAERITDEQFRKLLDTMSLEDALNHCTSGCSVEFQKTHRIDHINWWNREKLERMLGQAGFKSVYLSAREQSASPVMRNNAYFDNIDNKFVMYMEAVKI